MNPLPMHSLAEGKVLKALKIRPKQKFTAGFEVVETI